MSKNSKELASKVSSRNELSAFLQKVATLPKGARGASTGRLLFALDASASRERTWDQASQLQAEMFLAAGSTGSLEVQLTYFRGFAEFYKTPWCRNSADLLSLMTGIACRAGTTQIERVLRHALQEHKQRRIHCIVYVGDAVEENIDLLGQLAGQLGILGVPIFVFQEGADPTAETAFRHMARLSSGAYARFDAQSAEQLRELLRAVAIFASGGLTALEDFSRTAGTKVQRLTQQMRS